MNRDIVEVAFAVVAVENVRIIGKVSLENIEIPVEIEIPHGCAHAGLLESIFAERDAALEPLLVKSAIVLITKQPARSGIARDINIGPPVVVVVSGNTGHGIGTGRSRHSTRFTDFCKSSVAVVM